MEFDYEHSFSKDEAHERMQALGDYLQNRHGIRVTWDGDRGRFKGKYMVVSVEGELIVGEGRVSVRGKDPGRLWRKKATEYLRRKLAQYLDAGKPVSELPRR